MIKVITAKYAMVIGSVMNTVYVSMYLYPNAIAMYIMAAVTGVAESLLWVGQGQGLASPKLNISKC